MGLEGIVSKRADSRYRAGTSKSWIKIKNRGHPALMRVAEARARGETCSGSTKPRGDHSVSKPEFRECSTGSVREVRNRSCRGRGDDQRREDRQIPAVRRPQCCLYDVVSR